MLGRACCTPLKYPTQAKRGLEWATRGVSIKHLHRYLSEFEFCFNIRKDGDRFSRTLARMAGIAPMSHVELSAVPKTEA